MAGPPSTGAVGTSPPVSGRPRLPRPEADRRFSRRTMRITADAMNTRHPCAATFDSGSPRDRSRPSRGPDRQPRRRNGASGHGYAGARLAVAERVLHRQVHLRGHHMRTRARPRARGPQRARSPRAARSPACACASTARANRAPSAASERRRGLVAGDDGSHRRSPDACVSAKPSPSWVQDHSRRASTRSARLEVPVVAASLRYLPSAAIARPNSGTRRGPGPAPRACTTHRMRTSLEPQQPAVNRPLQHDNLPNPYDEAAGRRVT